MKVKSYDVVPDEAIIKFQNVELIIHKKEGIISISNESYSAICKEAIDSFVYNRHFDFSVLQEVLK